MTASLRYRVGVDIGGTFTDLVVAGTDGSIHTRKVASTPDDYSRAILDGLARVLRDLEASGAAVDDVVHATTVATNAVLERKGARTALITTRGFRDVLEMRRLRIPELYVLNYPKPEPLVPRRLRVEVDERMGPRGEVRRPLDEASVRRAVAVLAAAEVEAVAISLLHAYANPDHERRVAGIVRAMLGDRVYVSCSSDLLPEIREYERTSTTVINAYLGPIVERYLGRLRHRLADADIDAPLQIMKSDGGIMTAAAARLKPAYIVESGPAAGAIGGARVARHVGHPNVIVLDMGGTTAKAAMVEGGEVAKTTEFEVGAGINLSSKLAMGGGYAIRLPVIDVSEIGAGGGSIVSVDSGGLLHVGPRSAGAVPGPACYGAGGEEPTFTDALVALGYLNPDYLVGGDLPLDPSRAERSLTEKVAERLGRALVDTAYGIYQVAVATMVRAVKAVSTYRGRDPRDCALFAFGGNGPVVAAEVARSLDMTRALVPPHPGVFSAFGLLLANIEHELTRAFLRRLDAVSADELNRAYAVLEGRLGEVLANEGYDPADVSIQRYADLRYAGQAYELIVATDGGGNGRSEPEVMAESFAAEHERTYGHRGGTDPVECVNLRVAGRVTTENSARIKSFTAMESAGGAGSGAPRHRLAYFGPERGRLETPVLTRGELAGRTIPGPLIVEEYDATCVIPPHCRATLDAWGNMDIALEELP